MCIFHIILAVNIFILNRKIAWSIITSLLSTNDTWDDDYVRVTTGSSLANTETYCRSGNICEVLFFANFARRTNSRTQQSRENYYSNSASKEKSTFANSKLREKSIIGNSRKCIHAKMTRSTVSIPVSMLGQRLRRWVCDHLGGKQNS